MYIPQKEQRSNNCTSSTHSLYSRKKHRRAIALNRLGAPVNSQSATFLEGKETRITFLIALKEHATGPVNNGFRESSSPRAEKNPKRPIETSSSPEYLTRSIPSKFVLSTFVNKFLVCYPITSPPRAIAPILWYNDYSRGYNRMRAETVEERRQLREMKVQLSIIPYAPI